MNIFISQISRNKICNAKSMEWKLTDNFYPKCLQHSLHVEINLTVPTLKKLKKVLQAKSVQC